MLIFVFCTIAVADLVPDAYIVYPSFLPTDRQKRDNSGAAGFRTIFFSFGNESLVSNLSINDKFLAGYLTTEIVSPDGSSREAIGRKVIRDGIAIDTLTFSSQFALQD